MLVNIHTHRPDDGALTASAVGVHPWHAASADLAAIEATAPLADAVGEIGLDGACKVPEQVQESVFAEQLGIAERLGKPVIVHCVRRFERTMRMLSQHKLQTVIFHGFIGSAQQVRQAVERGYCISYGERAFASPKTVAAMRSTPPDRLFFETDDAEISIAEIYEQAAEILGTDVAALERITNENYNRIFG